MSPTARVWHARGRAGPRAVPFCKVAVPASIYICGAWGPTAGFVRHTGENGLGVSCSGGDTGFTTSTCETLTNLY